MLYTFDAILLMDYKRLKIYKYRTKKGLFDHVSQNKNYSIGRTLP